MEKCEVCGLDCQHTLHYHDGQTQAHRTCLGMTVDHWAKCRTFSDPKWSSRDSLNAGFFAFGPVDDYHRRPVRASISIRDYTRGRVALMRDGQMVRPDWKGLEERYGKEKLMVVLKRLASGEDIAYNTTCAKQHDAEGRDCAPLGSELLSDLQQRGIAVKYSESDGYDGFDSRAFFLSHMDIFEPRTWTAHPDASITMLFDSWWTADEEDTLADEPDDYEPDQFCAYKGRRVSEYDCANCERDTCPDEEQ